MGSLRRIRLEGVVLSFLQQINRVMKGAKGLQEMEFVDCKVKKKDKLSDFQGILAQIFPKLKGFVVESTSFRQLLGDVFIECIPSTKDKTVELLLRKKLNLEKLVVEDESIERTYLENVYIDILRL